MIYRHHNDLAPHLKKNRALVIYGPRRVGKTTLVENFLNEYPGHSRLVSGEDLEIQNILSSNRFKDIIEFCEGVELLAIDEAQATPNIGRGLKIIVDQVKDIQVIATGSSSFELSNQIGEPLVGRQNTIQLYPLFQLELREELGAYELKKNLAAYLRFGSYPEVLTLTSDQEKRDYLSSLTNSYLYKDILTLNTIKNSNVLQKLVKKLAFYVGSEIAPNQLSKELGVDVKTVIRYLDLLEKSFIILKLNGYSGNLAKEITKKQKYYFYDVGIRNAVINQFNRLEDRNDIGALWENFIVMERIKRNHYLKTFHQPYFWRNYKKQEVDYLEEKDGKLSAYEIKWSSKAKSKGLGHFISAYPDAKSKYIHRENYLDFLC